VTPRRLYAPVVLATLAAGGLAFVAAGRTWAESEVSSEGLAPATVSVSGSDAQPLVTALALVVVTAALAILAAGPRMRRVIGVLTVLVAIGGAIAVPRSGSGRLVDALGSAAEESPAYTGPGSLSDISYTPWDLVTIAAFVLALALGVVTVRLGPRWPTMGSRYDAPTARRSTGADPSDTAHSDTELSDTDLWKAMDDGRDPTA
jgi:uncharacterized membrane protein (TIGR02234 family)